MASAPLCVRDLTRTAVVTQSLTDAATQDRIWWHVNEIGALWNAEALCAVAEAEGHHATPRLIRDWGDVGLLDRPPSRRRERGRGGAPTLWPDSQRRLFLLLLQKREEGAPIAALTKVPVFLWLQWGDDYVPLRQTRRALATWAEAARHPSIKATRAAARATTTALAHPAAGRSARQGFRETITRGQSGETVSRATLRAAARKALDPLGSGRPRGSIGPQLTPEGYADHVDLLVRAAGVLARDRKAASIPAEAFEQARSIYRSARASYARNWRRFATDPELGHLHTEPTDDEVVNAACRDLTELVALWLAHARGWEQELPSRPTRSERRRAGFSLTDTPVACRTRDN